MNTLPAGYGGWNLRSDAGQYGNSDTRADHSLTNNIQGNSNTNVGNVSHSYNAIKVGVDEESLVHAWLSPLEPDRRHRDVSNRRLDGVGDWVLQRNEFESWRANQDGSGNPTLLCYGGQGAGKTYISSLVIDTLRKQASGQNVSVLSLYCDYQAQEDQSAVNMMGCLLSQVALGCARIPAEIQTAFELNQRGRNGLRLPDMLELFVKTISSFEQVYICFDAVDELLPQNRSELLRALRQIIQDSPNIRLFLTGRPHIRGEFDKHLRKGAHIIRIIADQGDIARYVRRKMDDDDDRDPDLMSDDLKHDILKTMLEKASEMFLLVALNIDAILGETSLAKRKKMLKKVSTTGVDLESVYAQTLQRIREQKGDRSRLGVEVLMWVSHAKRPLTIGELCHALAVEIESTDLDPENICPRDTVLASCLALIVVDEETSIVRPIHYTLQEYLCLPGILQDAHEALALKCLTYLNYDQVKSLPADSRPCLQDMPFLQYSSVYWGIHAKAELSSRAKLLALETLRFYGSHISAALLFSDIYYSENIFVDVPLFTGLHCASYFGIVELAEALIEVGGHDINQTDCNGFTPLMWAAHWGNEGVVRLLLAMDDVIPDKPNNDGQTPLLQASFKGHEGVVRLLLARADVNPGQRDIDGSTPFSHACFGGHEAVVRLLLARGVSSDNPNNDGQTPLSDASFMGHEGVVRLLLARGVSPDRPDKDGYTPLSQAARGGHEGVVRVLLARSDVNPDKPNRNGETPLWWASLGGHEGVVILLLARNDVNPDRQNCVGQGPLWIASRKGHEGVARLLLAWDDVNPDNSDSWGLTPLKVASINAQSKIVALLEPRTAAPPSLDQAQR